MHRERVDANIAGMMQKARQAGIAFRPHFKTHQSVQLGQVFRSAGVSQITVSSLEMACYFAGNGWEDITIAVPVNVREVKAVDELAAKCTVNILVEHKDAVTCMKNMLQHKVGVFIKVDCGYGRCGLPVSDTARIHELVEHMQTIDNLQFKGFLAHFGNTYNADGPDEIHRIYSEGLEDLKKLREHFRNLASDLTISVGDTPSLSLMEEWSGFDEARPGNFVYYDWMQHQLGSCKEEQIAVLVACPVIAVYPERNEVVVHAGAVHLSREALVEDGIRHYGKVVNLAKGFSTKPVQGAYVKKLSQEHGTLHVPDSDIGLYHIGDLVGVIPIHSCLSANLLRNHTFVI